MRLIVVMNSEAGDAADRQRLMEALRPTEVRTAPGAELPALMRQSAADPACDALVACGGDGTVNLAAGECVRRNKVLGVLPAGTLNHFAQDLNIPTQLDAAVRVLRNGRVTNVDVGEINGRVFVNDVSLGMYPAILRERDNRRDRLGWGKWSAFVAGSLRVLKELPHHRVDLLIDDQPLDGNTPFVFVGNNLYRLDWPDFGKRPALDAGQLSVFVMQPRSRTGLVALAVRALAGWLKDAPAFASFRAQTVTVHSARPNLEAGMDGELVRLTLPLRFRIRPAALQVLVP